MSFKTNIMKNTLTLLAVLFITANASAQVSFKMESEERDTAYKMLSGTFESLEKYVVIEAEGTSEELYQKTLDWINETYNTPDEVIKGKVDADYIRFQGSSSIPLKYLRVFGSNMSWDGYRYMVEIRFKDGRVRFEPTALEVYTAPSTTPGTISGWSEVGFINRVANKKGKEDKGGTASVVALQSYFNNLAQGLEKYYKEGSGASEVDDW